MQFSKNRLDDHPIIVNLLWEKETFDSDILKELNISENIFPKLFASENIIGSVFSSAAEESGLVPGIPVAAGQVDCNAGWVGAGAIGIGACQMNLGTAGNFGIVHDGSYFDPAMINFDYTTKSNKEFYLNLLTFAHKCITLILRIRIAYVTTKKRTVCLSAAAACRF